MRLFDAPEPLCEPTGVPWLLQNSAITAAKKVLISVLRHPLSACQMGLPGAACPLGLTGRIDVQHNGRHLGPIRALCVGIEEA